MSKITVTTIAGLTSGGDANKVKIESGDTLESSTIGTASGAMSIKPAGTEVVNIGTTGDILVKGNGNNRAALLLRAGSNTANSQIQLGDQSSDFSGRIMYDHSDDTMRFNTNGSERFRVSASGIHIGGTGAANALDDYEEGTWTPTAGSGAGTLTSSTGVYTKIGRVVYVSAYVTFTGAATGSNRTYGGLPFTVLDYIGATSVDFQGTAWSNNSAGYLYFEGGSSNFQNNHQKTFQGSFTASDNSRFQGFYFTT